MTSRTLLSAWTNAFRRGWLISTICLLVGTSNAWSQVRTIDVTHASDAYVVTVEVFAPVDRKIAWDVLTDFPHMTRWVPNLKESAVVTPGDRQMTIEQSGTAKFGGVGFSYTSLREIVLDPQTTIRSTQVKGSMRRQVSLMTLSTEGDGTRMHYRLEVVPGLLAAAAFSEDRLKQEVTEQFTAIVAEMTRRKQ